MAHPYPPAPSWDHLLDLRKPADGTDGVHPPAPLPPDRMRHHRHAVDPRTGWRFDLLGGRRPATRPARHDWAVTLTSPTGTTAAILGENGRTRHTPEEIIEQLPGLVRLLRAPSHRGRRVTSPTAVAEEEANEREVWVRAGALHRLVADSGIQRSWSLTDPSLGRENALQAVTWAASGLLDPAAARAWTGLGVEPDRSREGRIPWHATGFTPAAAITWMELGDDRGARYWADSGRNATEALTWKKALGTDDVVLRPDQVDRLERHHWTPNLLTRLVSLNGEQDRYRMLGEYLAWLLWPHADQPTDQPWQRLHPARLLAYLAAGVTATTEIDNMESAAEPPSDEQLAVLGALRNSGRPTPLEALAA